MVVAPLCSVYHNSQPKDYTGGWISERVHIIDETKFLDGSNGIVSVGDVARLQGVAKATRHGIYNFAASIDDARWRDVS